MGVLRGLTAALVLGGFVHAQADLFDVVRFGTLDEVIAALQGVRDVTSIVDTYGQDLLIYAANSSSDPEVIRYLVSIGFNVNMLTPQRWTPLMYAVRFNPEPAIASALLALGANPSIANSAGQTAADLAADNPNPSYATAALMARLTPAPPVAPAPAPPPIQTRSCCKYCSTGKACGDSCISRSYTCHRGSGCACNAVVPADEIAPYVAAGLLQLDLTDQLVAATPCEAVFAWGAAFQRPTA